MAKKKKKNIVIDTNVKRSMKTGKPVNYDVFIGLDGKVKEMVPVNDSFTNQWAGIGVGTDAMINKTEYPLTRMSYNYNLFNSLYRDNWVVQNIISLIPEDMLKNFITVKSDIDTKLLDRLNKVFRKTKLKSKILQGLKWGRLYGGAIGLILIEGQEDKLSEKLNLDEVDVDSFKGLYIVDRWNGVIPSSELIDDINDTEFGEPKYYTITNEETNLNTKIHYSRIIKFIGRELPHWEKIAEQYWGASEIESVYQEVIKRDNVSNNMANLTFKANIQVYEMENADQLFAIAGTQAQERFWKMMRAQSILESNFSTRVVNKGDNYRHEQYGFSGLSEVYDSIMMDVAGSTHIPVTKLFGRSPSGMNATGESDLQNYYDFIDQERESKLNPIFDKLLPIIAMSTFGEIPDDLDYKYGDIKFITDESKNNIGNNLANVYMQAFQNGAITQKTLLKELSKLSNEYSLFTTLNENDIDNAQDKTFTDIQSMQDPMAGLSMEESEGEETNNESDTETENVNEEVKSNDEEPKKGIIGKIIENITGSSKKSHTIESGEKQPEYLIGAPEPNIEGNRFEELKQEDLDRNEKLNKASNMVNEMLMSFDEYYEKNVSKEDKAEIEKMIKDAEENK